MLLSQSRDPLFVVGQRSQLVGVIEKNYDDTSAFDADMETFQAYFTRDAQEGDIIVDGIELTNDVRNIAAIRSEIGMVFQQFNLFPHLTVLRNLTLAPMRTRGPIRAPVCSRARSPRVLPVPT